MKNLRFNATLDEYNAEHVEISQEFETQIRNFIAENNNFFSIHDMDEVNKRLDFDDILIDRQIKYIYIPYNKSILEMPCMLSIDIEEEWDEIPCEIVSIDDPRNNANPNEYSHSNDFAIAMEKWYIENNWELPATEDFQEYYSENVNKRDEDN